MRKVYVLLWGLLLSIGISAQAWYDMKLNAGFDGILPVATRAGYFEDPLDTVRIENLINNPGHYTFLPILQEGQNTGFTRSAFWIRLQINYTGITPQQLLLEVARPVTNQVILYRDGPGKLTVSRIGDDFPFSYKEIPHRNNIFPLHIQPVSQNVYYIKLKSDGEAIHLALNLSSKEAFQQADYKHQLFSGFFYGILFLVILTNLFFFFTLREINFLNYVFYISGISALHFSLDGYSYQYLFPEYPYWANLSVLLSAALTLIFFMYYTREFLRIPATLPRFNKVYNAVLIAGLLTAVLAFIPGIPAAIGYPAVNFFSLAGILLVLASIIILVLRGREVSGYFVSAITILIIGTCIFILSNINLIPINFWTYNSLKIGNAIEAVLLSFSIATRYRKLQEEKEQSQQDVLRGLTELNRLKDELNIRLETEVEERTRELKQQKELVESKNADITKSLQYARSLQAAVYPSEEVLRRNVKDHFIVNLPKDIVSGDFYWFAEQDGCLFAAVADCTGHGVPGAFMSMLGIESLNQIVERNNEAYVAAVLGQLDDTVKTALSQGSHDSLIAEHGMDIALIKIDPESRILYFCGANRPLCIITQENETSEPSLVELKPNKKTIGGSTNGEQPFEVNGFAYDKPAWIYLFTDGFADQFGGPLGKKLMRKNLKEWLCRMQGLTGEQQKEWLIKRFSEWRGNEEQVDDVCVMGIRV